MTQPWPNQRQLCQGGGGYFGEGAKAGFGCRSRHLPAAVCVWGAWFCLKSLPFGVEGWGCCVVWWVVLRAHDPSSHRSVPPAHIWVGWDPAGAPFSEQL